MPTMLARALLLLMVVATAAAGPVSVVVRSCAGCRLNKMPVFRRFLERTRRGDGEFENVSVEYSPGEVPRAMFIGTGGARLGEVELERDLTVGQFSALCAGRGLQLRRRQATYGDAPRTYTSRSFGGESVHFELWDTRGTFAEAGAFAASRTDAAGRAGRVYAPRSAEESEFVAAWLRRMVVLPRVWLDATDSTLAGSWRWESTGRPLSAAGFSAWADGEPASDMRCATVEPSDGAWHATPCLDPHVLVVRFGDRDTAARGRSRHDEL